MHMLNAWILQTNLDHLLPVRMVHVCIKDLLTVSKCYSLQALRDVVKWSTLCFYNFSVDLLFSENEAGRLAG